MLIHNSRPDPTLSAVLAIGTFDGVHLGHQRLLKILLEVARTKRRKPCVALFPYSPRLYLSASTNIKLLTSVPERRGILQGLGIQEIREFPLDHDFLATRAEDFLCLIKHDWKVRDIVCGENFAFGKDRAGNRENFEELSRRLGISFHVVKLIRRQTPISSTRIRGLLAEGDLERANRLLGRSYFLSGRVVPGQKIASKLLGFPTANIKTDPKKLLPLGVFCGWVREIKRWAILNIGYRPTVSRSQMKPAVSVEAHIPNFEGDLYGKELTIDLARRLRQERTFKNLEDLRQQIAKDIKSYKRYNKLCVEEN